MCEDVFGRCAHQISGRPELCALCTVHQGAHRFPPQLLPLCVSPSRQSVFSLLRAFSAMASLRREVLGGYRRLMRVRVVAFKGDSTMLEASKEQLRIEFNKNKAITDPSKIGDLRQRRSRPSVCFSLLPACLSVCAG